MHYVHVMQQAREEPPKVGRSVKSTRPRFPQGAAQVEQEPRRGKRGNCRLCHGREAAPEPLEARPLGSVAALEYGGQPGDDSATVSRLLC